MKAARRITLTASRMRACTAEIERNTFRRATRQRTQQIAANRLLQTGLHGTAQLRTGDVAATDRTVCHVDAGKRRAFCLDRRHDGGAGVDEFVRRHGLAGAGVARGAGAHPAVGVHRRGVRRDAGNDAAALRPRDGFAARYGGAGPLSDVFLALCVRSCDAGLAGQRGTCAPRSGIRCVPPTSSPRCKDDLVRIERDLDAELVVKAAKREVTAMETPPARLASIEPGRGHHAA